MLTVTCVEVLDGGTLRSGMTKETQEAPLRSHLLGCYCNLPSVLTGKNTCDVQIPKIQVKVCYLVVSKGLVIPETVSCTNVEGCYC